MEMPYLLLKGLLILLSILEPATGIKNTSIGGLAGDALTTGEIRLIRNAISGLKGIIEKIRPIIKYNGLPGG